MSQSSREDENPQPKKKSNVSKDPKDKGEESITMDMEVSSVDGIYSFAHHWALITNYLMNLIYLVVEPTEQIREELYVFRQTIEEIIHKHKKEVSLTMPAEITNAILRRYDFA